MPTGSSLWHFLYHLVRKFIRSAASTDNEKKWQLVQTSVNVDTEN